jgi:ABC-type lipoprotein release transport system permease subunit
MEYAYISAVFRTDQATYDDNYLIVSIQTAQRLFKYGDEVSAIELKLLPGADIERVKEDIHSIFGDNCIALDRMEQQETSYRMVQTEKWIIFLILCFILLIALFTMVSSLSMLMIEKKEDVKTLSYIGASERFIRKIFLTEGCMITGFGAFFGVALGLGLCLIQQKFGLIKMGEAGSFVVDNYPVVIEPTDIIIVLATVIAAGFLSAWYPVCVLKVSGTREQRRQD